MVMNVAGAGVGAARLLVAANLPSFCDNLPPTIHVLVLIKTLGCRCVCACACWSYEHWCFAVSSSSSSIRWPVTGENRETNPASFFFVVAGLLRCPIREGSTIVNIRSWLGFLRNNIPTGCLLVASPRAPSTRQELELSFSLTWYADPHDLL